MIMDERNENVDIQEKKEFEVPKYLIEAKNECFKNCHILYCGRHKPITHSMMPFGWEHGDGWNNIVADLSYNIEMLNLMFYPKYGIRVEAVQVKEKFGELRFYYDIITEPPKLLRFIPNFLENLHYHLIKKVDFGYRHVRDMEPYTSEEWEEISSEDFENRKTPKYAENNYGWKFKEEDGKFYRNYSLFHPEKWHMEITKNKFLHALDSIICKIWHILDFRYSWPYSKNVNIVRNYVDSTVQKYIDEACRKCYDTCEECGMQIGNEWSPRCTTTGWILHVCEDCAKRIGRNYSDDKGNIYDSNGNIVKRTCDNEEDGEDDGGKTDE